MLFSLLILVLILEGKCNQGSLKIDPPEFDPPSGLNLPIETFMQRGLESSSVFYVSFWTSLSFHAYCVPDATSTSPSYSLFPTLEFPRWRVYSLGSHSFHPPGILQCKCKERLKNVVVNKQGVENNVHPQCLCSSVIDKKAQVFGQQLCLPQLPPHCNYDLVCWAVFPSTMHTSSCCL